MYAPQLRCQLASVQTGANFKKRGQLVGPCLDVCSKGLTCLILTNNRGRSTEVDPTKPPCCVCFGNGGPLLEGTIAHREHKHKSSHGQEIEVFNQASCPEKRHSKVPRVAPLPKLGCKRLLQQPRHPVRWNAQSAYLQF